MHIIYWFKFWFTSFILYKEFHLPVFLTFLNKLKKELTISKAAEQLNLPPQVLTNFLVTPPHLVDTTFSVLNYRRPPEDEEDLHMDEEEADSILPDLPNQTFQQLVGYSPSNASLENCPDITIVKKERTEEDDSKTNNNSNHSDDQLK